MKIFAFPISRLMRVSCLFNLAWIGIITLLCFISAPVFSQALTVTTASQIYKLPDQATLQTAPGLQSAIATAEAAGKALTADAAAEKTNAAAQENALTKSKTMEADYFTAVTAFSKNDVEPYNADLKNYTDAGTKFTLALSSYNKAVMANNALPAKNRKAATVAALNKQKAHIDSSVTMLSIWKGKLDKAKAKLDVKNNALKQQKNKYERIIQTATTKLKASGEKLKNITGQLSVCESYAAKCHGLLMSKFNGTPDTGYFGTNEYKNAFADLTAYIAKLNAVQ